MANLRTEARRIKSFLKSSGIDALAIPSKASRRSDSLAVILGRNGYKLQEKRVLTINIAAPEELLTANCPKSLVLCGICKLLGINIIKT